MQVPYFISIAKEDRLDWNVVETVHFDQTHIALTDGRMKEWKMRGPPSLMATSITGLWLLAEEEKGERWDGKEREGRIKRRKRRESHHPSGEPQRKNVARGHNKRGPRS